jgi:hypothetical protein
LDAEKVEAHFAGSASVVGYVWAGTARVGEGCVGEEDEVLATEETDESLDAELIMEDNA